MLPDVRDAGADVCELVASEGDVVAGMGDVVAGMGDLVAGVRGVMRLDRSIPGALGFAACLLGEGTGHRKATMFFRAQNLGPIRDAEVDLSKRLIVLAGPNNTGKTYLAWSVYGLNRVRLDKSPVFERWAQEVMAPPGYEIDFSAALLRDRVELLDSMAENYLSQLHLCFAAEKNYFAGAKVSLRLGSDDLSTFKLYELFPFGVSKNQIGVLFRVSSDSNRYGVALLDENSARLLSKGRTVEQLREMSWRGMTATALANPSIVKLADVQGVLHALFSFLPSDVFFPNAVIFPAERIAVNIFAKELALKRSSLVDQMVDADIEGKPEEPIELIRRSVGRYPWPIRDSLQVANDLASLSKYSSPFADLADELEGAVLGGKLSISEHGEMLFAPRGAAEKRLGVHLTASVVKSLSSLVFYFRHLAKEGDFLIIDEPELNLHPDNQRLVARLLAKAIKRGFKIMLSTHSDYILRELNHLIMLHKLSATEAEELGYDPACALDPEKVGVYLFNEEEAHPVPIEDTGFSIQTIDEVTSRLNADEQRLYARLFRD